MGVFGPPKSGLVPRVPDEEESERHSLSGHCAMCHVTRTIGFAKIVLRYIWAGANLIS